MKVYYKTEHLSEIRIPSCLRQTTQCCSNDDAYS